MMYANARYYMVDITLMLTRMKHICCSHVAEDLFTHLQCRTHVSLVADGYESSINYYITCHGNLEYIHIHMIVQHKVEQPQSMKKTQMLFDSKMQTGQGCSQMMRDVLLEFSTHQSSISHQCSQLLFEVLTHNKIVR